jgi:hypothetical protein
MEEVRKSMNTSTQPKPMDDISTSTVLGGEIGAGGLGGKI